MKKENLNGVIYITSDENEKFVNGTAAIMACQMIQMYYAQQNNLTTNSINLENGRVELTVYFDKTTVANLPKSYLYTKKVISSHEYWSDVLKKNHRVRVINYYFKF